MGSSKSLVLGVEKTSCQKIFSKKIFSGKLFYRKKVGSARTPKTALEPGFGQGGRESFCGTSLGKVATFGGGSDHMVKSSSVCLDFQKKPVFSVFL